MPFILRAFIFHVWRGNFVGKLFKVWIESSSCSPAAEEALEDFFGPNPVNARESIRVTGGNIDWIYPGRNKLTSYTID